MPHHPESEQSVLPRIKLPRFLLYLFAICLSLISLAACGQQAPDTEQSAQEIQPPTLTPLSTDWVELTLVFEDEQDTDESAIAVRPTEIINTLTPTPTPTASATTVTATPTAPAPTLVQPSTPTTAPTSTPIPLPTQTPTATPIPATVKQRNLLIASRSRSNESLSLAQLQSQIRATRGYINDLNFIIGEVEAGGDLNCPVFASAFESIRQDSPAYLGTEAQQTALYHYNRSVEGALTNFYPLYELCRSEALVDDAQFKWLAANRVDSETLFSASDARELILRDINDALAWSNGDLEKTRGLYQRTRIAVNRLGRLLDEGTTTSCPEIRDIYAELESSPRLIPAEGESQVAYKHYLDALRFVENGIGPIDTFCEEYAEANAGIDEDAWAVLPLPEPLLETGNHELLRTLTALNKAVALLPVATPVPTLAPLWGDVLAVRESWVPDHFEVVVRVYYRVGGADFVTARLGDFEMESDGKITITHRCDQDLVDSIIATTAEGEVVESPKVYATRHESCFNQ